MYDKCPRCVPQVYLTRERVLEKGTSNPNEFPSKHCMVYKP